MQLHMRIAENDLNRKLSQALKALDHGEQVRVTLQLKGREKSRPESAVEWLNSKVLSHLLENAVVNKPPSPTNLNIVVFPKKR